MENNQYIVALEIGSTKIVAAVAEKSASGYVNVTRLDAEALPSNCVRYGWIMNIETTKNVINKLLHRLSVDLNGDIKSLYVGVGGRSVHSEKSQVSRSIDSSKTITDDLLNRIISSKLDDAIKNYETIGIVPRYYVVDGQRYTESPRGLAGSKIDIDLNMIVGRATIKQNLDRVLRPLQVRVEDYIVTPLAVADEILQDNEKSLGCMLVDMGAETTEVAIYKEGTLAYLATLPLGGRNITRDLTNGLPVMEDTAERVKKNLESPLNPQAEVVEIEGVKSNKAAEYISARTGEIIANIERQIQYAGFSNEELHTIVLIGGGASLNGFANRLSEQCKIPVRKGSYPSRLNLLDQRINRPDYVEVLSLLAKAADIIPDDVSCVERHVYESPVIDTPEQTPTPVPAAPPKPEKPRRRGIIGKLTDALGNLMSEPIEEDDDEEK